MKPTVRRLFPVLYIASLLPPMLPVPALAGVCPTTTMDQILLLGNCTIGGANFDFTQPQLSGHPACFNGPFVGNTGRGPATNDFTFTPNALEKHKRN